MNNEKDIVELRKAIDNNDLNAIKNITDRLLIQAYVSLVNSLD